MKPTTKHIGNWGEELAVAYLEKEGFTITEKNWRTGRSEIDLIGIIKNTLVFIEVKVRKNNQFGNPEEFVGKQKANRIKEASIEYQIQKKYEGFIRFDIVAITGTREKFEILHFPDSF
jgi:putative endonuclease